MKKALIVLSILLVIAACGLFFLASNANSLIAKYKPDLERIASETLGSHVTLGKLEASVFPSAKIQVDEFKISREANSKDGLSLKNLTLNIRLLPLLSGNLNIVKLGLDSPAIIFLKDKNGISIEGLPKPAQAQKPAASEAKPSAPDASASNAGPVPAGLGLNLEKFELRNARIVLRDIEAQKDYSLSNIDVDAGLAFEDNQVVIPTLKVTGKALDKIDFKVDGEGIGSSLAGGQFSVKKISVNALGGTLDIDASGNAKAQNGKAHISSSGYELSKLTPAYEIVPALASFGLKGTAKPEIDAQWGPHGSYSAKGHIALSGIGAQAADIVVSELNGQIQINATEAAQNVEANGLNMKLGSEAATLNFAAGAANNQAELKKLELLAFGGNVTANANLAMSGEPHFSAQYTVSKLAIDRTLQALKPALASLVSGTIESVNGNITGIMGENLKQSLNGSTTLLVTDGSLKGVNIAADVLRAVKDLPFLTGSLYSSAPPAQQSALQSSDTGIGKMSGNFKIQNAALSTQDFFMSSALFNLKAQGSIGFDMNLDLASHIAFDPTLSAALTNKTQQLKGLLDDDGRLELPLLLKGVPPKILILPDLQKVIELAAKAAVKEGATKLLEKALGGGGKTAGKKGLGGLLGF